MCLDFSSLDLAELRRNIANICTPSAKSLAKSDPIWGKVPKVAHPFTVGVKKHGKLIEHTIIKLVRSSMHWDGVKSYKLKISGDQKEFDNIVFNKSLKVIIVLESKRDVNQVSGPYKKNIQEYIKVLPSEAKRIGFHIFAGLTGYRVYFAVFNAYGAQISTFCGKPVIEPKHLRTLFSECVAMGWEAFEKEKYDFFLDNDIEFSDTFQARVKNYKNFNQLEEYFSTNECQTEEIQKPEDVDKQIEIIESILGKPMLIT